MAPEQESERRPLLSDAAAGPDTAADHDNDDAHDAAPTRSEVLRVAIPGVLIIVSFQFFATLIVVGLSALMEGAVCKKVHPDVTEIYSDPRCGDDDVQAQLAMVIAFEQMFTIIPGFLTLIPYGIVADKFGPKIVLMLVFVGDVLAQGGEAIVCAYPEIFDLKWIYFFACMTLLGGGPMGQTAMQYAMAGTITTKQNRAIYFFYMEAIGIAASFLGGPAAYLAMKKGGALLTQSLGVLGIAFIFLLTLTLPNVRISKKRKDDSNTVDAPSTGSRIARHASDVVKEASHMFRTLFWNNLRVGMVLFSLTFISLGSWEIAIRLQYAKKRYDWTWGEGGLLSSVKSAVNLASVAVILPGLSTLLTKRYKASAVTKDLWLARGTVTIMVIGSVLSALAPTGTLFVMAVVLFELSKGCHAAIVSLIASLTEPEHHSLMYVCMAIMQSIGSLSSPPVLSAFFSLGLRWGPSWYGLSFMVAAMLQFISMVILYSTKSKEAKKDEHEDED